MTPSTRLNLLTKLWVHNKATKKKIKIIVDKVNQTGRMSSIRTGYRVNQKNPRLASQLAWYRSHRVFIDLDHILSKGLGHKLP